MRFYCGLLVARIDHHLTWLHKEELVSKRRKFRPIPRSSAAQESTSRLPDPKSSPSYSQSVPDTCPPSSTDPPISATYISTYAPTSLKPCPHCNKFYINLHKHTCLSLWTGRNASRKRKNELRPLFGDSTPRKQKKDITQSTVSTTVTHPSLYPLERSMAVLQEQEQDQRCDLPSATSQQEEATQLAPNLSPLATVHLPTHSDEDRMADQCQYLLNIANDESNTVGNVLTLMTSPSLIDLEAAQSLWEGVEGTITGPQWEQWPVTGSAQDCNLNALHSQERFDSLSANSQQREDTQLTQNMSLLTTVPLPIQTVLPSIVGDGITESPAISSPSPNKTTTTSPLQSDAQTSREDKRR